VKSDGSAETDSLGKLVDDSQEDADYGHDQKHDPSKFCLVDVISVVVELHGDSEQIEL
jgi:hypothetical protein